MRRFARNRWFAFILALSVLTVSGTTIVPGSFGSGMDPIEFGGGSSPSSGGDPDGPAGPTKRSPYSGRVVSGGVGHGRTSVGDGGSVSSVLMWRIQVVLRTLLIRFERI